jgi:hypothetical protein
MASWTAPGWRVEFVDVVPGSTTPAGRYAGQAPAPMAGPHFAVHHGGYLRGRARTEAELVALGVPEILVARIKRAVHGGGASTGRIDP